ncbi:MAG: hypothetical protein Kow00121_30450 [Elainellaceae cyanobacterium]
METKAITIRVNAEAARIFEAASEAERLKIEAWLSLKLSEATRNQKTLEAVMSEISDKAQQRGLTPDILDSLLSEQ